MKNSFGEMDKADCKKVLIITYYWPPCGGIGVLRCLKFAKYLRDFGWEPVIFTAKDAHYPSIDPTNEKDIPEGTTILRQKIWEPYHLYKFFTGQKADANVNNVFYVKDEKPSLMHKLSVWIRSNFFIPDARAQWIHPSVKFLLKYLEENPVDAILSNGPPHSNTRIATLIKQKTGIPWLADFQDPWTQVDYFQLLRLTPWGLRKHQRLEQEAFQAADHISIVSPTWKEDLIAIGAQNVSVIPWGFDPDDYEQLDEQVDEKFTISHLGIMGYDRHPQIFFEVIKKMMNQMPELAADLELNLYGQVDYSIVADAKEKGIEKIFQAKGNVPRKTALEKTCSSNILLLLLNKQDNVKGRIPGKLFEYLAARRPILVLGPPESDVAKIIEETQRGFTIDYDDAAGLERVLKGFYEKYKNKTLGSPLSGDISAYASPNLTAKVAAILDKISSPKS